MIHAPAINLDLTRFSMRLLFTIIAFIGCFTASYSQTFNGTGGNIPNLATTQTCFNATVSGVGVINGTRGLASVCMNISHADVGDLEIVLRGPDGTVVPLTMQNGGAGNNYNLTCFSATATIPIKTGTAPFNGTFLPEGHLGAVNNGQNADGVWSLCILDRRNNSGTGTVNSWSLIFSNTTPAPPPPALPTCAQTIPTVSSCATASLVCDFNGLCGNTTGGSVQTWPALTAASCFSLQNNSFIRFIASSTTASFSVWNTTSRANYLDGGLQMLFFSATCGGPVTTYGCYEHIYPNSGTGQPTISVVSASGLTPGNTYYLMIDGFNGDNVSYTIAANTGINILTINPTAPAICAGSSVNLTATGGNGTYTWAPPTGLNTTSGSTVTASPAGNTTYTVTSTTPAGCPITSSVLVTVNPLPAAPTATITTQPTCNAPTGTITITAPVGPGLQYSINGGPLQSSPVFTGLSPNTGYTVTVTNTTTNCTSPGTTLSINTIPPSPPAPTATVTQPTCGNPLGSITITAPLGAGLQYSINGSPYQPGTSFPNLPGGVTYNVTVQNAFGCTSPVAQFPMNAQPTTPAAPTATVTQPTCGNALGTITITSPLGVGLQYSINGGPYQSGTSFPNLPGGVTYNITVQNAGLCVSPVAQFPINAQPATPAAPVGTVTSQPSCSFNTATITITSPVGPGLQYSINGGPLQTSPVFTGAFPQNSTVTVQNAAGCTSPASAPFVFTVPFIPSLPTTVNVQPTCTNPTGSITFTSPLGPQYVYSLILGATQINQATPAFLNLAPGQYTAVVRLGTTLGCENSILVDLNPPPGAPAAPTATVAQPCTNGQGSITVTAPTGPGLQYSINGGPYQSSPVFPNLPAGPYTITVQDAGGCTSAASSQYNVNPAPVLPATPAVTITQPTCTIQTGTITFTDPVGPQYLYRIIPGNATAQSSPVFPNLTPGNYVIIAGVVSPAGCFVTSNVNVNAVPAAPVAPTGNVLQPPCPTPANPNPTGIINITAPVGAGLQYSINGGPLQISPSFGGLVQGSYTITVQDAGGCVSVPSAPFIVNAPQAIPTFTLIQPTTCTSTGGTVTVTSPLGTGYTYSLRDLTTGIQTPGQNNPVFNGVAPGNYLLLAQYSVGPCITVAQLTIDPLPVLPSVPVAVIVQPTCNTAEGTITVTSPLGANYEYSLSGGSYQASPVFNDLIPGSYSITVRNSVSGCVSPVLSPLDLNVPAGAPVKPILTVLQPGCTGTQGGSITVTSPLGAGLEYNLNGGTFQTNPVFPGLTQGTYLIRVRNAGACISPAETASINAPQTAPAKPVIVVTQPSCPLRVGEIRVTSPVGANIEYSINGITYQSSNIFPGLTGGNYTVTARITGTTCVSPATGAQLNVLTPDQCIPATNGDIYFPSAFTPNGDGINDGFGPGPKVNLSLVTGYTLMVFNRYGEKVFETNNPLVQWNGTYKGKMLANYSFTWVAKYKYGTRAVQMQKGSLTIIR